MNSTVQEQIRTRRPEFDFRQHPAIQILDELQGLLLKTDSNAKYQSSIRFEPSVRVDSDDAMMLSAILNEWIIPIGQVVSEAMIGIGDLGAMYLVGTVSPGVFLAGLSFAEGMERLLRGDELELIDIDNTLDPEGKFIFPYEAYPDSRVRIDILELKKRQQAAVSRPKQGT